MVWGAVDVVLIISGVVEGSPLISVVGAEVIDMVEVASSDSVVRILVVEGLTEVVLAGVVRGVVGLGRVGRSVEDVTDPSTVV